MRAGIALGSNLGDRLGYLRSAFLELRQAPGVGEPIHASRIYETEPVQTTDAAGAFLNAVVEVEFAGAPAALLRDLHGIEQKLGRPSKHPRNASRTIDLDLLYAGDGQLSTPEATLPHPRAHLRRFVLQPLQDVRPELVLPGQSLSVAELLNALPEEGGVTVRSEALVP